MQLQGIHHVTAITGDAPANVLFYTRTLGLRLIKKTVNFDAPDVYHLYFGDEKASPGTILTFFEFPGAVRGRAGAGMVHRMAWHVGSAEAILAWEERLDAAGVETIRAGSGLRFDDPEGLGHELVVDDSRAERDHGLRGLAGARAYARDPEHSSPLLEALGLDAGMWGYDEPPEKPGVAGAGTVHHIAWASRDEDHEGWREVVTRTGMRPTPVIDRQYFRSIYFREPSGVLFEIATLSPGFAVDEDPAHLGEALKLPSQHEHRRAQLERSLTPLPSA